jgi:hypothetical protein
MHVIFSFFKKKKLFHLIHFIKITFIFKIHVKIKCSINLIKNRCEKLHGFVNYFEFGLFVNFFFVNFLK